MDFYELSFFGLRRRLPLTHISKTRKIANFNLLGDVEFTEKAGEELEKKLQVAGLKIDCFVGPEVKVVPFVHHMAKRYGHDRYVILRKSVRGYMVAPVIIRPSNLAPKHVDKLVLNGLDKEYIQGKRVAIVDDVISTGATMDMVEKSIEQAGGNLVAKCAILKQGADYKGDVIFLKELPIYEIEK